MSVLRVAIIGAGPRGAHALELLLRRCDELGVDELQVDVHEPHPAPGAGPVYDPRQPAYLRMNVAAGIVGSRGGLPVFAPTDPFPPRAEVGAYLAEAFRATVRSARAGVRVRVIPARVTGVRRRADGWLVESDLAGARSVPYDEVLLATGHVPGGSVFPVDRWLTDERVPAGAVVAVRGFALTCIDAALALTEGRGGSFRADGGHPWRLRYEHGADEVAAILPFSRTGLPMLAKPAPDLELFDARADACVREQRALIRGLRPDFDVATDLLPILDAVAEALARSTVAPSSGDDADTVASTADPAARIAASLDVALGLAAPDRPWLDGHAWRLVYPAIVDRLSGAALAPGQWRAFAQLAAHRERLAFGPPPVNAAKLVALIDAGLVDLRHLASGSDGAAAATAEADVLVDAVLAPPGAAPGSTSLFDSLRSSGAVRSAPEHRGMDVLADATCVGADGAPTPGLAAIGRPTEDSVIGNDTLSRELHPHVERWAARVATRARTASPAPALALLGAAPC